MAALCAPLREVCAGALHAAAAAPVHRLRHVWLGEGVRVYFWGGEHGGGCAVDMLLGGGLHMELSVEYVRVWGDEENGQGRV